ncbi:MAG TPA: DUF262 domain-containing HNH endonuclease family protein [Candidatus Paceibacterota bacterium]|nr:DUF262 domain-containing HNH endonuclease family protein [Candidatus Paceibacterota bacterium]
MKIEFDANDKKLKELFGEEKYIIPRYQRPYSWTVSEVEDLWNDITRDDSIFLGSFVFNYENYEKTKFVEVIDGQQRLITLTIFFAVLRDVYKELKEEKKSNKTQELIAFVDDVYLTQDFRLKCGDSLAHFFEQHIQKGEAFPKKIKRKEHKQIRENYEFLLDKIKEDILEKDTSEKIKYVDELKRRIFDFKIILIQTKSNEDAYSIFETVNARGADLTSADLLKNYIFGQLSKQDGEEDYAKVKWSEIVDNVESVKGKLSVSKLIRYFWLSKYGFTTEKKLYKEIKKEIKDYNKLLEEIHLASDCYAKMVGDVVADDWEEFEDDVNVPRMMDAFKALRIMGITQPFPIIFVLLMNHSKIPLDFSNFLKMLENHHFAFSAVCKLSGNVVEKIYYKRALEIQKAITIEKEEDRRVAIETIFHNLINELKQKHYPSKEQFIEKFMDLEYPDNLIKYIFSKIENDKNGKCEKTDWSSVNIEHILPQNPTEWGKTKKDVREYVDLLGNLTLVSKKINGSIGNKPLEQKVKEFEKTKLKINEELIKQWKSTEYNWTEKEILDRQKALAEYAYEVVWKF